MSPAAPLGGHPWLDAYAAPTAVPGGGSAAAVAGALGCALVAKAARIGARKAAGGPADGPAETLGRLAEDADRLRGAFLHAEATDAAADEHMIAASRAVRAAPEDRDAAAAAEAAATQAARAPLETAELATRGLAMLADLAGFELARTASDQVTAAHLLLAALEGGLATATANLPALGDSAASTELATRGGELAEARRTARSVLAKLEPMLA